MEYSGDILPPVSSLKKSRVGGLGEGGVGFPSLTAAYMTQTHKQMDVIRVSILHIP